jgi:hypothetical protein
MGRRTLHRGIDFGPGEADGRRMAEYDKKFDPVVLGLKKPRLRVARILALADAHRAATGRWPTKSSGLVRGSSFGTTWLSIDFALRAGRRGPPGGQSLWRLLQEHRGVEPSVSAEERRNRYKALERYRAAVLAAQGRDAPLTIEQILTWVDEFRAATGRWPKCSDGPIEGVPGESWRTLNTALTKGLRGLPGSSSLARLLDEHRRPDRRDRRRDLTMEQIHAWAEAEFTATGLWPRRVTGPVTVAPGEKWYNIDEALQRGLRGLPGRSSLFKLFGDRPPRTAGDGLRHTTDQ